MQLSTLSASKEGVGKAHPMYEEIKRLVEIVLKSKGENFHVAFPDLIAKQLMLDKVRNESMPLDSKEMETRVFILYEKLKNAVRIYPNDSEAAIQTRYAIHSEIIDNEWKRALEKIELAKKTVAPTTPVPQVKKVQAEIPAELSILVHSTKKVDPDSDSSSKKKKKLVALEHQFSGDSSKSASAEETPKSKTFLEEEDDFAFLPTSATSAASVGLAAKPKTKTYEKRKSTNSSDNTKKKAKTEVMDESDSDDESDSSEESNSVDDSHFEDDAESVDSSDSDEKPTRKSKTKEKRLSSSSVGQKFTKMQEDLRKGTFEPRSIFLANWKIRSKSLQKHLHVAPPHNTLPLRKWQRYGDEYVPLELLTMMMAEPVKGVVPKLVDIKFHLEQHLVKRHMQDFRNVVMVSKLRALPFWQERCKIVFVPLTNEEFMMAGSKLESDHKIENDCSGNEPNLRVRFHDVPILSKYKYLFLEGGNEDKPLFPQPYYARQIPFSYKEEDKKLKRSICFSHEKYTLQVNFVASDLEQVDKFAKEKIKDVDIEIENHANHFADLIRSKKSIGYLGKQRVIPTIMRMDNLENKGIQSDLDFVERLICVGVLHNYNLEHVSNNWFSLTGTTNYLSLDTTQRLILLLRLLIQAKAKGTWEQEQEKFKAWARVFFKAQGILEQLFVIVVHWHMTPAAAELLTEILSLVVWFKKLLSDEEIDATKKMFKEIVLLCEIVCGRYIMKTDFKVSEAARELKTL